MTTSQRSIPLPALSLALAGLIPIAACGLQIATSWPLGPRSTGPALYLLLTYGAVILSFLGGIQWGLAVGSATNAEPAPLWRRYAISIVPPLVAWAGLYVGARNGLVLVAVGFVAQWIYDLATVARGEAPLWFGRLRTGLTAAVTVCLLAAVMLGPF